MCDFGPAPKGIKEKSTGRIIMFDSCKNAHLTDFRDDRFGPHMDEAKEEGMYHICATGAFYAYFDGQDWWKDTESCTEYEFIR
jgi:hypothetical protein